MIWLKVDNDDLMVYYFCSKHKIWKRMNNPDSFFTQTYLEFLWKIDLEIKSLCLEIRINLLFRWYDEYDDEIHDNSQNCKENLADEVDPIIKNIFHDVIRCHFYVFYKCFQTIRQEFLY